ncbi:MAG TPA: Uma2 family endonuclease [Chloroflexota bacterium]|nr:Uma2 family endonuclease [Chloroflexota bacterium]
MTIDDLLALPDDDWQYELVEGRLVRMPPSGIRATSIGCILAAALVAYVRPRRLGVVTGEQGGYRLAPATALTPDVGFMRSSRLPPPTSPDYDKIASGAPDLAVEVASPHQYRPGMRRKAQYYLAAGTQLVWIVWPRRREIDVWEPANMQRPVRTLRVGDTLDGGIVLPGFTYPVAEVFD